MHIKWLVQGLARNKSSININNYIHIIIINITPASFPATTSSLPFSCSPTSLSVSLPPCLSFSLFLISATLSFPGDLQQRVLSHPQVVLSRAPCQASSSPAPCRLASFQLSGYLSLPYRTPFLCSIFLASVILCNHHVYFHFVSSLSVFTRM